MQFALTNFLALVHGGTWEMLRASPPHHCIVPISLNLTERQCKSCYTPVFYGPNAGVVFHTGERVSSLEMKTMHLLVQVSSYKWSISIQELFFTVYGWGALRLIHFGGTGIIYLCAVGMLNILKTSFCYVQSCKSHKIRTCFKLIVQRFSSGCPTLSCIFGLMACYNHHSFQKNQ